MLKRWIKRLFCSHEKLIVVWENYPQENRPTKILNKKCYFCEKAFSKNEN